MRNIRDRYGHVCIHIFLIRKQKQNDFRLSVLKTYLQFGFFGLKEVYMESTQPKFRLERTKTYDVTAE